VIFTNTTKLKGALGTGFLGILMTLKPALVEPRSKSTRTTYDTPGDSAAAIKAHYSGTAVHGCAHRQAMAR